MTENEWHADVPDADSFGEERDAWRAALAADSELRQMAVDLQVAAERVSYTYVREWLGVPIIRLAEDIVVLQELIWEMKPDRIVETGIARGGSLLLNASLQRLAGLEPKVLGIDNLILEHTHRALAGHPMSEGIEMFEGGSTDDPAVERTAEFLAASDRALLVLDSNHTHDHVLDELRRLAILLPVGSYVMVADTLVEEYPAGHYADRPWDRGNNPMTAVRAFLAENNDFEVDPRWARRALVSESRDGILRRLR